MMQLTASVATIFLVGFTTGVTATMALIFIGWLWKCWCERVP